MVSSLLSFNYQSNSHWEVCVRHAARCVPTYLAWAALILISAAGFPKNLKEDQKPRDLTVQFNLKTQAVAIPCVTPGTDVPLSHLCFTRALHYKQ